MIVTDVMQLLNLSFRIIRNKNCRAYASHLSANTRASQCLHCGDWLDEAKRSLV